MCRLYPKNGNRSLNIFRNCPQKVIVHTVMVSGLTKENYEYKEREVITRGLRFVSQGTGKGCRGNRGQRWCKTNENKVCERYYRRKPRGEWRGKWALREGSQERTMRVDSRLLWYECDWKKGNGFRKYGFVEEEGRRIRDLKSLV